jgi:SAM-dependent methyltransferase
LAFTTTTTPGAEASAFDELALSYDTAFGSTALGTSLRAMVRERLEAAFAGRRRILEIGCGTGDDAIELARRGVEVLAIDAAPLMLRVAAAKAAAAGCAERIDFRYLPMERLGAELAGETFDGVFSNFGAMNCAPELDRIAADVAGLLEAGAPLVWVLMGRHVPWEWAWFLARGEWRKAFRRTRKGGVVWHGMRISYPTPAQLERALRPYFVPTSRRALGVVLPPTYAGRWLERSPRALAALVRVERALQRWQALSAVADHYVYEARRLGTPSHA